MTLHFQEDVNADQKYVDYANAFKASPSSYDYMRILGRIESFLPYRIVRTAQTLTSLRLGGDYSLSQDRHLCVQTKYRDTPMRDLIEDLLSPRCLGHGDLRIADHFCLGKGAYCVVFKNNPERISIIESHLNDVPVPVVFHHANHFDSLSDTEAFFYAQDSFINGYYETIFDRTGLSLGRNGITLSVDRPGFRTPDTFLISEGKDIRRIFVPFLPEDRYYVDRQPDDLRARRRFLTFVRDERVLSTFDNRARMMATSPVIHRKSFSWMGAACPRILRDLSRMAEKYARRSPPSLLTIEDVVDDVLEVLSGSDIGADIILRKTGGTLRYMRDISDRDKEASLAAREAINARNLARREQVLAGKYDSDIFAELYPRMKPRDHYEIQDAYEATLNYSHFNRIAGSTDRESMKETVKSFCDQYIQRYMR